MHAAARAAVRRGAQLETTIEGVLRLARDTHPRRAPLVVSELLDGVRDYWRGAFVQRHRELRVGASGRLPEVRVSAVAVRHVVDVLVDNALVHGAGDAEVAVSTLADGLLIEVSDDGPGLTNPEAAFTPRTGRVGTHGIGLGLARSVAEAEGGRLLLRRVGPRPVFAYCCPARHRTKPDLSAHATVGRVSDTSGHEGPAIGGSGRAHGRTGRSTRLAVSGRSLRR